MSSFTNCANLKLSQILHKITRSDSEPTLATLSQGANNNNRRPSIAITRASVERFGAIWCTLVCFTNTFGILCFVEFFVHGQIQTDVRKSILPKYDSFPLNHGQKNIFDFILQNVSFCIQTTQRVVHTPSIFLCRFLHWMSFTDILRDRDEGEGWSNCSSRLPSHLTLGSSMAITSPQVETRSPSHKKSQKVKKVTKSNNKSQKVTTNLLQATTPLSLFLNTTETSATPVQRSVTPLLFPEHRLQSPVTPGWCRKVKMTPEWFQNFQTASRAFNILIFCFVAKLS